MISKSRTELEIERLMDSIRHGTLSPRGAVVKAARNTNIPQEEFALMLKSELAKNGIVSKEADKQISIILNRRKAKTPKLGALPEELKGRKTEWGRQYPPQPAADRVDLEIQRLLNLSLKGELRDRTVGRAADNSGLPRREFALKLARELERRDVHSPKLEKQLLLFVNPRQYHALTKRRGAQQVRGRYGK